MDTTATPTVPDSNEQSNHQNVLRICIHQLFNEYCNGVKILDFRPKLEYRKSHIRGAIHVDINDDSMDLSVIVDLIAHPLMKSDTKKTKKSTFELVCIGDTVATHARFCSSLLNHFRHNNNAEIASGSGSSTSASSISIEMRSVFGFNSMKSIWTNNLQTMNANMNMNLNYHNATMDEHDNDGGSTCDLFFAAFVKDYGFVCEPAAQTAVAERTNMNTADIAEEDDNVNDRYHAYQHEYEYPNVIIPNKLYLGNRTHRKRMVDVSSNPLQITHILNVTPVTSFPIIDGQKELQIAINDWQNKHDGRNDISKHFGNGIRFIHDALMDNHNDNSNRVFVHCEAGISRSTSMVIAYLMAKQNYTLYEAYKHTKQCRPVIHPNPGFYQELILLEKQLYDGNSTQSRVENEKLREYKQFSQLMASLKNMNN